MKRCTRCGEEKPHSDYNKRAQAADGLRAECRACHLADAARYRAKNPEKLREWKANNPDRVKRHDVARAAARRQARYAARVLVERLCEACGGPIDGDKRATARHCSAACAYRAKNRQWAASNPALARAKQARYRAKYPDKVRARNSSQRALKVRAFVEEVYPLVVLERDDGICGICGEDVDPFDFHVDHIIPLSRGGEHSYANTQPAHPFCNLSKNDRLPWEVAA